MSLAILSLMKGFLAAFIPSFLSSQGFFLLCKPDWEYKFTRASFSSLSSWCMHVNQMMDCGLQEAGFYRNRGDYRGYRDALYERNEKFSLPPIVPLLPFWRTIFYSREKRILRLLLTRCLCLLLTIAQIRQKATACHSTQDRWKALLTASVLLSRKWWILQCLPFFFTVKQRDRNTEGKHRRRQSAEIWQRLERRFPFLPLPSSLCSWLQ